MFAVVILNFNPMKKIIFIIGLTIAGGFVVSCCKDNQCEKQETSREIRLEKSEVVVKTGTTQVVEVVGEGPFEVTSSDEDSVLAQVKGNRITIIPVLGARSAVLTVKDTQTQKTAQIKVKVEFNDEFVVGAGSPIVLPIGTEFEVTSANASVVSVTSSDQGHVAEAPFGNNIYETELTLTNKQTQQTQKIAIRVVSAYLNLQESTISIIEGLTAKFNIFGNNDELKKYSASENDKIAVLEKTEVDQYNTNNLYIKGVKRGKTLVKISNGLKEAYLTTHVVRGDHFSFKLDSYAGTTQVKVGDFSFVRVYGHGDFEIEVQDPAIASAKIEYLYNDMFNIVVEGKTAGTTTIFIKDKKTQELKQIQVQVM